MRKKKDKKTNSHTMQRDLNLKVQFRESFRPFARSVLADRASQFFNVDVEILSTQFVAAVADKAISRAYKDKKEVATTFALD